MKSSIFTIMRKEFARFFKDKRLVITTIILPGLLIYLLYSFMGSGFKSMFTSSEEETIRIIAVNFPKSIENMYKSAGVKVEVKDARILNESEIQQVIKNRQGDIYAVFPSNFDEAAQVFASGERLEPLNVDIFYDSTNSYSSSAYNMLSQFIDMYESNFANLYNINASETKYDVATDKDTTGMMFSMMMPMLLITFMFTGCMAIAPESIAGEKERGTIASLLVTPTKRSDIAIGKIVSLSCIALLSGISSFTGTMASLPKLMGGDFGELGISAKVYGIGDYLSLLAVVFSTVLLLVSLISIISAFANSVKEASTLVMPLMIVVMLLGVTSMFGGGAPASFALYLIPVYNSVQCINGVFSFTLNTVNLAVSIVANLAYTILAVFALKKMFDSERFMFSK